LLREEQKRNDVYNDEDEDEDESFGSAGQ